MRKFICTDKPLWTYVQKLAHIHGIFIEGADLIKALTLKFCIASP